MFVTLEYWSINNSSSAPHIKYRCCGWKCALHNHKHHLLWCKFWKKILPGNLLTIHTVYSAQKGEIIINLTGKSSVQMKHIFSSVFRITSIWSHLTHGKSTCYRWKAINGSLFSSDFDLMATVAIFFFNW